MNFIKARNAFTLAELMVGITIISILAIGVSNINFNRLNTKQKLEIFTNNIKTDFETIRNNALSGKGIGANLDVPQKWKIDYSMNNSGTIISSKFDGTNWLIEKNLDFPTNYTISSIKCGKLNEAESFYDDLTVGGTGTIIFEGVKLSFDKSGDSNCELNADKILEFTINDNIDKKTIIINTLNGLIDTK
ncbi:MAG: prepilin-type N-terminal cleavage/methylation domain-containing protein [Candidatus Gracilibacteria bacterium]|nr:prepilin-type N-terminal cleavage/methylation domain-containing protein [Candidatus Gracilibacteria bacterium]